MRRRPCTYIKLTGVARRKHAHRSPPKSSSSEVKHVSGSTHCCSSKATPKQISASKNCQQPNSPNQCHLGCVAGPSRCGNARKLPKTARQRTRCHARRTWATASPTTTRRVNRPTVSLYASLLRYRRKTKYRADRLPISKADPTEYRALQSKSFVAQCTGAYRATPTHRIYGLPTPLIIMCTVSAISLSLLFQES